MTRYKHTLFALALVVASMGTAVGQSPRLFEPGVISTGDYELNAAFSQSGDTLLFTRSSFGHWYMTTFMAIKSAGKWRIDVAPFSGLFSDADASFSPDGKQILFISDRPGSPTDTTPDFNIWRIRQTAGRWGEPEMLPEPINSPGDDYYPGLTRGGTIYFSSMRPGGIGRYDIYRSRLNNGVYQPVEMLPASVNHVGNDIDLYVDPDERFIIFASYGRKDEFGQGDLYISLRCGELKMDVPPECVAGGEWTNAENLGRAVNSKAREYTPFVFEGYLYFTSERNFKTNAAAQKLTRASWDRAMHAPGNGSGDIYRISIDSIKALAKLK